MEILAVTTHWFSYLLPLLFLGGVTLISIIAVVAEIGDWIKEKSVDTEAIVPAIVVALIIALFSGFLYAVIKHGPDKTYDAKVTDFNEVYNKGYIVKGKRGDLYQLEKSEAN